jgi:hypothetical protein
MSADAKKELLTERISAGSRTYFLDVKRSSEGKLYLVISESRAVGDNFEHSRVMVFEDHLEPLIDGLRNAIMFCRRTIAAAKSGDGECE